MNRQSRPALGKGIGLRRESDGTAMLLVPEGALFLNSSAAAAIELVDGKKTVHDIIRALIERFDVNEAQASQEVLHLFARLAERRFVRDA
ncbi:MAG: pyrroloquinoline quinone biosynthesis peptide chaperone PqqD [Candidatus Eremiobacteraeota bacterium]|nr:pyrroloquinoline quinone biosynthesis peptide chaperone PqqD [Candidatus Eremiobacteraeota bacterium]